MVEILRTTIQTIFAFLAVAIVLEQVSSINPFIGFIVGFIFGIGDFVTSYYGGWGIMSWIMGLFPKEG